MASQKTPFFTVTAVKTTNLTYKFVSWISPYFEETALIFEENTR
jgi:hypothetical protein